MIIYLENTLSLLVSLGQKELVENLIKQGEIKQTESAEQVIKYLKV